MGEINMSRAAELTGTNLWTVVSWKRGKTQAGDLKAIVKYRCGDYDFEADILLGGKGWKRGRDQLTALGVPLDFDGDIEDLPIKGVRVWIATHIETREDIARSGPDTGKPVVYKNLRVNGAVLSNTGFQPEANVPAGCAAPVAGGGPDDSETPF
jgi:hypothetical protein